MADDTERIYKQNEDQYAKIRETERRISILEAEVATVKNELIGATGQNGFRGEFREFRRQTEEREAHMIATLRWMFVTTLSIGGLVVAAMGYGIL